MARQARIRSRAGVSDRRTKAVLDDLASHVQELAGPLSSSDRALRVSDLVALGIVSQRVDGSLYIPGTTQGDAFDAADYKVPDAPANFAISGAMLTGVATWDAPTYRCHSHTEIWGSDTDDISTAILVAHSAPNATSAIFSMPATFNGAGYFWARHISVFKVAGPFNATAGTSWTSGSDLTGIIVMWSGAIGSIPAGWALCDGGGTPARPDLRDQFIVGAGGSYAVGATGGATTDVTTGPSATTTVDNNADASTVAVGSDAHTHTADILPPYYALAFIIYEG